ncbi:protein kinase and PP2C-like domain-containing protein isoform X1 [Papaver somniferum]|uniref:protein kinase and PP2C-like domain-containing protein isoform X1 n=1 Tax=Papaver somniferum TaxID=3469 RepID=UPI000E6FB0C7|nr:protein kinase and PP2C-like domain-containing protein isoform X1 [Papaver somniferum]
MVMEIVEPNTCVRGCCKSKTIPLHLLPSTYTLLSPIAKGSESVVYEAILNGKKVAVKKPILATSDDLDRFHKELQLLCKLDDLGIATLIAAHAKPPNYMFFFQFYESGDLSGKLHVQEWIPSLKEMLHISLKLAKSLQYLHNLGIVHRDVKPANVLASFSQLDRNLCPHLSDFGLAVYKKDLKHVSVENWRSSGKPTGGFHKKNMVGTLIYMAPEILRKDIQSEKSDVYSFGITINELFTGVVPYTDLRAEAQAHTVLEMNYSEQQLTAAVVSQGLRPVLAGSESGAPDSLAKLIQRCWDADPLNRPSFDDIIAELDPIMKHVCEGQEGKVLQEPSGLLTDLSSDVISNLQSYQEAVNWYVQGEQLSKDASSATDSNPRIWHDSSNGAAPYNPTLSSGSFATCGRRESMEDTHFLMPSMCRQKDVHLFGIFDGHRGAAAAEFSVRALPRFLQTLGSTLSPSDALTEAFMKTDIAFRDELIVQRNVKGTTKKNWHPGCCANAALIVENKLFVANAGDCRTILCRAGTAFPLTKDHTASCIEERERVIRAGGQVKWQVDNWRVGTAALQVTRSIGDDDLKPAVTAEPEIRETTLTSEDEYLVMASDGLWDVVSSEDVISIIRDTVKEPGMCSKRLATEAAERGSKDNITVIVVFLRPVSTAERIY